MLGGISVWQLLIILAIVIMIFGTKKLRSLGGDLGGAIKSFKKAVNEDDAKKQTKLRLKNWKTNPVNRPTPSSKPRPKIKIKPDVRYWFP